MKVETTGRGFGIIHFIDRYGVKCSLQESSLGSERAIWLGCDDANPQYLGENGWQPVKMPDEYLANTRAHLNQKMVKALLPHLIKFAKTGEI